MTKLIVESSCEIENLIDVIVGKTDKDYEDVENAIHSAGIAPESNKTYITTEKFGLSSKTKVLNDVGDELKWLDDVLFDILKELNIDSIYITEAI